MKLISSMAAVTTGPRAWRMAASPPAESTSFMMTPPWTNPARLESSIPIAWDSTTWDSLTVFSSFSSIDPPDARRARHPHSAPRAACRLMPARGETTNDDRGRFSDVSAQSTGAEAVAWALADLYEAPDDGRLEADVSQALSDARAFRERYHGRVAALD